MRNKILPITIFTFVLLVFAVFIQFYIVSDPCTKLYSSDGVYDLSGYEYNISTSYALIGNWNYQNKIDDGNITELPYAISRNSGETIYTSHIKLPEAGKLYCILIPRITSDYRLVINGNTIYENGIYSGKISYINHINTYTFYVDTDEADIEIHTYALSALPYMASHISFGSPVAVNKLFLRLLSADVLFIVIMICSGLYYFILSIFERNHRGYQSFSFLCILMALRASINNTVFLGLQFTQIPNAVVEFIIPLITPLLLIGILYYLDNLHNQCFHPISLVVGYAMNIIYMLLALFFNYMYYNLFLVFYYAIILYTVALLFHTGIKFLRKKMPHAKSFILSSFIILVSATLESLFYVNDSRYGYALNIGFVFYIILQTNTILISLRDSYSKEIALSKSYDEILEAARVEKTNFLSSHLKPHFVFNSLNIISGYALFEPEKAKAVCSDLEIYMRQLFEHNNINETNSLNNEINLAKAFGYIETERFPNITIEYDISDGIGDTQVPSMLIQPLLENAVNHGIRKRSAKIPGTIVITVKKKDKFIYFSIWDDGVGMSDEEINRVLQPPADDKYHGLFQLSLRLEELYHEKLNIESSLEEGTCISFKLPI